jgi:hypothetical protein
MNSLVPTINNQSPWAKFLFGSQTPIYNNNGDIAAIQKGLGFNDFMPMATQLGGLWAGFKGLGLAKDNYNLQKKQIGFNIDSSIQNAEDQYRKQMAYELMARGDVQGAQAMIDGKTPVDKYSSFDKYRIK